MRAFKVELEKFMKNDLISPNVARRSFLPERLDEKTDVSGEVQKTDAEQNQENKVVQNDAEAPIQNGREVEENKPVEPVVQEAVVENPVVEVKEEVREEVQAAH